MRLWKLAIPILLAAGSPARAFDQNAVALGGLPPIAHDYKARISKWARTYYADPRAVGPAMVSDPVLVRDGTGRLLWLVCFEAANASPSARSTAPERFAFGFAPNYVSAPLDRRGATLLRADCEERPLAWRPFREFGASDAVSRSRRGRA